VSGGKEPTNHAPVVLEDCCYIGPQTVIRSGITIGKHSVVGSCSYVNKDIPPMSIAVGTPAIVVGNVVFDVDGLLKFEYD
jgi:acetyltransferase-like isoleucine patch superfamily enzyme